MAAYSFDGAFANINNALGNLGKQNERAYQLQALGQLGQDIQSGNYAGAAQKAFALGDADTGIKLATLGRTAQQESDWMKSNGGLLGLGSAPAPVAAPAPMSGDYFGRTAAAESSGNDTARNPSSTATGRYQFLQGTWNGLMKSNPELGLTADGRTDPQQQERAMRAFTAQNAGALKAKGIEPTDGNLYMAHFLGAGAAPNFINAVQQDPTVPAASLVRPEVVAANRSVFLNADGTPKSAGEVYQRMTSRFGNGSTAISALSGGQPAPVQVAQAPGASQADLPAQGAAPVQGFAVPGGGADASIANDPTVIRLQRALMGAPAQAKAVIQSKLDLAVKDAERRYNEGKAPESVREWQWARRQGLTDARSPVAYAKEKAEATRQDSAPTVRQLKQADGSEVAVQWNAQTNTWDPLKAPRGGEAVRPSGTKLTEGQSKDLIYHSRGLQALEAFEPIADAYADGVSRVASQVPGGNYVVPEQFQMARQAGRNFLASVLRKDTGAAVTPSEEALYGDIFLPAPGDKPGTLALKADARKQAIDAIRGGLGTAEVLALGKRLTSRQPGQDAPARPEGAPAAPQRPAAGTPRTATNPNTGERIMLTPDGQWVPYS